MGENHDGRAGGAGRQVCFCPSELIRTEHAEAARLEVEHVRQRHEVHPRMIEAVIAPAIRDFPESIEVFADARIRDVMLARDSVQLGRPQARQELLRQIELRGLREMRDVAGVNDE